MAAPINIPVYSDALVVLGACGVVVPIVRKLGVSPVLGYLGAGALLGPLGLGSFIETVPFLYWVTIVDAHNVASIAELGVVFLLFLIGLELSYERLMSMRRLVFGLGGLQVLVSAALISYVALEVGVEPPVAILIGACLALSSTAIVLEILAAQGRLKTTVGRASFSVLLAQDLAVIPILIYASILGGPSGQSVYLSVALALAQAVAAVIFIVVFGRVVMRPVFHIVASAKSTELFIAAILFVVVGSGVVAALSGLSMALGAFVAGLLLAETAYRKAVEAAVAPFKGLLLGVFFLTIGMNFDVRDLAREPLWLAAAVAGILAGKTIVMAALARAFRLPSAVAVESALLLAPAGEFAFVGLGLATALGLLDQKTSSFVVAATCISMAFLPALASLARKAGARLEKRLPPAPELSEGPSHHAGHAIVIGHGRVGKVVCALMRKHKIDYVATDHDAGTVVEDRRAGHDVYFGDARNPGFLEACGLAEAAGVVVTIGAPAAADAIVAEVRAERPDLPIFCRARDADHARRLYAAGVTVAVPETIEGSLQLSEAALVGLGAPMGYVIASLHDFRDEVQKSLQAEAIASRLADPARA